MKSIAFSALLACGLPVVGAPARVTLVSPDLRNGSFEDGSGTTTLTGWITGFGAAETQRQQNNASAGSWSLVVGQNSSGPNLGAAVNTGHVVLPGDTFDLSFDWLPKSQWTTADHVRWRLFTTSDDTPSGTLLEVASGVVSGHANGAAYQTESRTGIGGIAPANVGRLLWLQLIRGSSAYARFARVDRVTLAVTTDPSPVYVPLDASRLATCLPMEGSPEDFSLHLPARDAAWNAGEAYGPGVIDELCAELSAAEGPESLALVIERWPHTEAALAAGSLRLQRAVTAGDVGTAAEIVIGGLVRGWEEQGASRGFEERLLQLGQTFEASGNDLLAQAWWQHVGARWKGASQDLLARRRPAAESPRVEHELPSILEPRLELGTSLVEVARTQDEEGTPWLILQNERDVLAIKGEGAEPAWSERVNGGIDESHRDPDRRVLAGGWVHLALGDILCSWELTTGRRRDTTWGGTSGYITSAATDNGILFVTRREADATVIYALEPRTGDRLWRRSLPARTAPGLVLGDGYVVAIPEGPRDAVVLDQLTGLERSRFRVSGLRPSEIRSAFIEAETLILPAFQRAPSPATNVVRAWSLDTGERAWQVLLSDLGRGYEATHVLRSAGRTWLVLSTRAGGDMVRSIHELQTTRGVVSPVSVAQLAPRSVLLGLRLSGLVELDDPIVLAADSRRGVVQAIDLEQGMLWTSEPIEGLTLARGSVLTPVVGRERVATLLDLSYGGTMLAVFDRARGHLRAAREFQAPARRGPSERTPELAPWNGGLWLTTSSATQYLK